MRLRPFLTLSVALAATLVASGCANESSTAPQAPVAPAAPSQTLLSGVLGSPTTVTPLYRTHPLAADVTVSKTIGLLGGTLSIPAAGITVVVPPLAVGKNTAFKITARAGSAVAYDFEPHGTKFLLPLVMTQNLTGMQGGNALLGSLQLGYYPDATHITTVTELLSVNLDLLHLVAVSTIWHFSGYIYMSGRSDEDQ